MKKDALPIIICIAAGLIIAFAASGPLRKSVKPAGPFYAQGTILLSPELEKISARPNTLFIIARAASAGMPIAAQKIDNPGFPLKFQLGTEHNMVGTDFMDVGDLTIVARLDADGSAGPAQPGDREGTATANTKQGEPVSITIE